MSLDEFIIAWFCLIDDALPMITGGKRLWQAGLEPKWHWCNQLRRGLLLRTLCILSTGLRATTLFSLLLLC